MKVGLLVCNHPLLMVMMAQKKKPQQRSFDGSRRRRQRAASQGRADDGLTVTHFLRRDIYTVVPCNLPIGMPLALSENGTHTLSTWKANRY